MNGVEKLIDYKRKMEWIIEDLESVEIKHKGHYGTLMYVRLDGTARIYLEDEEGRNWEEDVKWE